jgi:acetyltransferase
MNTRVQPPTSPSETRAKVEALLNPRNIVILGASDKPGSWTQRVWRNARHYKFPGPIYPMNPGRDRVWDTRCYRSFADLPEPPDHVVVLIPAAFVPDALVEAARAGARSATVMTSGFAEATDAVAKELSKRLVETIKQTGLAVSGPNCLGNLHAPAGLMTMPDDRPQRLAVGPVAIISQSGGIAMAIKRTLEERGIDTASVVTSGNEAGLSTADYIAYYAEHPDIRIIVSYLEGMHDAPAFLSACRMARAAGKPVVVMKLGASEDGRAAALAHTGALAGSMQAFDAVAATVGAIRVRTLDDVVETVEYFVHTRLPRGGNLGGITFSGALRGLLLDGAANNGLTFSPLSAKTRQRLESLLTVGTIIGNPLDSGFAALTSQDAYLRCVEIMLDDPGIDVLILQEELPRAPGTERKESNLRAVDAIAAKAGKPIVFVSMISYGLTDYSRLLRADLPHLSFQQEVDKTMRALRSVVDYAQNIAEPALATKPSTANQAKLKKALAASVPGCRTLSEVASKALLKAYGLRTPKEAIARSEKEALAIAKRIGFPVVAKAVAAQLTHKSDVGGVIVGLRSAKEVREAYRRIVRNVARRTGMTLDGVLIAEQVSDGAELVLGAIRDPEVGPVILFGSGGVQLELHRDVAIAALPLDEKKAISLIDKTRVGKLIQGYRGGPVLDRNAVVKALIGLSQLIIDAGPRIDSIDVNPFLVRRHGGVALDALVVLADDGG